MLFNVALFDSLLLASIVRAAPFVFHRDTPTHLGSVVVYPPETVLSVVVGITTPMTLTGLNDGDQVYITAGLDGFNTSCGKSSFQAGIFGTIDGSGQTSYSAIFHDPRFGDDFWDFVPPDISPGDYIVIAVAINPNDMTSGYGMIANMNKPTRVQDIYFSTGSSSPLCSQTGGWFIQIKQSGGDTNLGTINFLHAEVNTSAGMYYPSDSNFTRINDVIGDNNQALYIFETNGDTITAQHG